MSYGTVFMQGVYFVTSILQTAWFPLWYSWCQWLS